MIELVRYQREDGTEPFTDWFRKLRNHKAKTAVAIRLRRMEAENFGDCKALGDGVSELRIHVGAGYRVYFGKQGSSLVILLCGGDKSTQSKDIVIAKALWVEWKRRQP